jgi:hypothetical protein
MSLSARTGDEVGTALSADRMRPRGAPQTLPPASLLLVSSPLRRPGYRRRRDGSKHRSVRDDLGQALQLGLMGEARA